MEASGQGAVEVSKKEKRRRWGVGDATGRRTYEEWIGKRAGQVAEREEGKRLER